MSFGYPVEIKVELLNKHSNEQGLERLELENRLKYTWKSEEEGGKKCEQSSSSSIIVIY